MSNFFVQELVLYRHFMLIDSPIPFELVANPTNYRKDERGNVLNVDMSEITGRDICSRPAGAWRVDCWTLLPEQYHKQNPVFTMLIKYDRDLLEEGEIVDIRYSDIDIGEGVAGVNGQLVSIPADDFRPVGLAIETASAFLGDKIDESHAYFSEISADVDSIEAMVSDIVSKLQVSVVSGPVSNVFSNVDKGIFEGTLYSTGRVFVRGRWVCDIPNKKFILVDADYLSGVDATLCFVIWSDLKSTWVSATGAILAESGALVARGIFKLF